MTCDHRDPRCACPFAPTDASDRVQNYGCLATPREIVVMRVFHGKTWACHADPAHPCVGAIRHLRSSGLPYAVIDPVLLTERSDWARFVTAPEACADRPGPEGPFFHEEKS